MNQKIRKAQLEKTPLMIIIGDKEVNDKKLSVRLRNGQNFQDLTINSLYYRTEIVCGIAGFIIGVAAATLLSNLIRWIF